MGSFVKNVAKFMATRLVQDRKKEDGNNSVIKKIIIILVAIVFFVCLTVASFSMDSVISLTKTVVVHVAKDGVKKGKEIIKDATGNIISFTGNITDSLFGDKEKDDSVEIKDLQGVVDSYDIEYLIRTADDEDIMTDEALKKMMLDRKSYKALLQSIYKYNKQDKIIQKKIQCKHTYTTKTVVDVKDVGKKNTDSSSGKKDEFAPSNGNNTKNNIPGPGTTSSTSKVEELDNGKKEIKEERHTEYVWKNVYYSSADTENQYSMYWQPVLISTLQSFIYNYGELTGLHKNKNLNNYGSMQDNSSQNNSTSEGEKLVSYAKKFLGNPYVYGGTSLTKGCDCSGFVMKIYEHFGYTLPHSSEKMRKYGIEVCGKQNYDEGLLQKGDIICYEGHVGIYIGNGKIINASNKRVGITTYKVLYRKDLVTVRRILNVEKKKNTDENTEKKKSSTDKSSKTVAKKKTEAKSKNGYKGADKKLVGNDNPSRVWNFFKAKGLSDIAVSAIMGNIEQESHFNPRSHSDGTSFYGIFQWGANAQTQRWTQLKEKYPGKEYDLLSQLKFSWWEMTKGGRKKTLPLLSRAEHLDYKNESDRGAVWIFAYYFEGCVADDEQYGLQNYKNRYEYAKKWLDEFGGKTGSVTDGKIYNAGDVGLDDAGIGYGEPQLLGKYNKKTGLVKLSEDDIATVIDDFKPVYNYDFDVMNDSKKSYTFDECKKMKNNGLENDGGDPNTEEGILEWYTPASTISTVALPYGDITYNGNIPSCYEFNEQRWKNIMSRYIPYYNEEMFLDLVKTLPNGGDFAISYNYFKSLADGSSSSSPANNPNISTSEGDYEAMKNVIPSIKIPKNAGGMSIPLYLQTDARWKNVRFGGNTIATSGCSVTSLAMVLSYMKDQCIYPDDVVDWTGAKKYYSGSSGASWNIFGDVAKHWGLKCKQQTVNANAIKRALKNGQPVIVSTTGYGTKQEFTKAGHFIVLRGLTKKGYVLVNDPNDNTTNKAHYLKSYRANFIVSECTQNKTYKKPMWIFSK